MKRVNAIIEARMGSTRLPGKTMLSIMGKPSIELLIERLRLARKIDTIILATTTNLEDDVIESFCKKNKVICYRGSSDDVLGRVYNAAKYHKTDIVVEVTGDCPLLDPWLIDDCIDLFIRSDYDYLSNFIEQSYPPGIDVQIFSFKVLEEINKLAKADKFREHVTLYILKHPEKYRMHNVPAPPEFFYPDWHLELDEQKDYELIKKIYKALYFSNPSFTTRDIINLLKANPEWLKINVEVNRIWEKVREEAIE
jgi:spore coat polysaccharide biosynthesis protein SpsF